MYRIWIVWIELYISTSDKLEHTHINGCIMTQLRRNTFKLIILTWLSCPTNPFSLHIVHVLVHYMSAMWDLINPEQAFYSSSTIKVQNCITISGIISSHMQINTNCIFSCAIKNPKFLINEDSYEAVRMNDMTLYISDMISLAFTTL